MLTSGGVTSVQKMNIAAPLVEAKQADSTQAPVEIQPISKDPEPKDRIGAASDEYQRIGDFQGEVGPIVLEEMRKIYPEVHPVTGEIFTSDEALDDFYWYWDNDNLKVVFTVQKEDSKKWQELRKNLEVRLGDKVVIKKSKKDFKHLEAIEHQITEYLVNKDDYKGSADISWSPVTEVITAQVSDYSPELANEIKAKFPGEDIEVVEFGGITNY
jgi:hypothetical protein